MTARSPTRHTTTTEPTEPTEIAPTIQGSGSTTWQPFRETPLDGGMGAQAMIFTFAPLVERTRIIETSSHTITLLFSGRGCSAD